MTTTIEINDVTRISRYVATSGQTLFTVPFAFYAVGDLKVYLNNTLLTYNAAPSDSTEYSVQGAGSTSGGTITIGTGGAALNDNVTIISDLPVERVTDFPISGPFQIEQLNEELDKLTIMISQNETALDKRVLRLSDFDDPTDINEIPDKATRALKVLGFDADGNPIASDGTLTGGLSQLAAVTPTGDQLFYINNSNEGALVDFTQFAVDFIDALSGLGDPDADAVLMWDDSADTWVLTTISNLLTQASRPSTRTFTGTTDTLVLADAGNRVQSTNASAVTVTIPPLADVAWTEGDLLEVKQGGIGTLTIAEGAGVTIESFGDVKESAGQNAILILRYEGSNIWALGGELDAGGAAPSEASTSEIFVGSETGKFVSPDKFRTATAPVTLTDAATIAVDFETGRNFTVTLGGNRTLGNPTNVQAGDSGVIYVIQDGTGSRTLAYASNWKAIGSAPTIDGTASVVNVFSYFARSSTAISLTYLGVEV
jgi:hypothetical protein